MFSAIKTVINPQVPIEQPPDGTERKLSEYLSRMFRYCSQSLRRIFEWQKKHLLVEHPVTLENPHPQYFHKVQSSIFAGMAIRRLSDPLILAGGQTIRPFSHNLVDSWQIESNKDEGTLFIPSEHSGIFFINLSGFVKGRINTTYVIAVMLDNVDVLLRCAFTITNKHAVQQFSYSTMAAIGSGTITVKIEFPISEKLQIFDLTLNVHSYIDFDVIHPDVSTYRPLIPPVPPGWAP